MGAAEDVAGRTYQTAPYLVSAEKIREFRTAIGDTGDGVPPTFVAVITFQALNEVIADLDLSLHRLLHGDQKFVHHRPVAAGDELVSRTVIDSVRRISGAEIYAIRTEVSTVGGELVSTAAATLLHRPEDAA
ncbi:FAS1-like dehydratase domain-containing protein [Fodinicola acaciae]|uniref:FAS1-like dehydratase domain-containing protein n=1 Tax=Fodinicola acaciae TaxID=2681555 RepID=UPI0013D61515|nr:MaoC family dehydratase N-terminal domain-containing protein [Fodinicola acaciae]